MKTIEIDEAVHAVLVSEIRDFGETANDVIKRLLASAQNLDLTEFEAERESRTICFCREVAELKLSGIKRYLMVLRHVYEADPKLFVRVIPSIKGTRRNYISESREAISRSGNNTMPRQVVGTPIFAATNLNKSVMERILIRLLRECGYPNEDIEAVRSLIRLA